MTLTSSAIDTSTHLPTGAAATSPATQSTQTHRNDVTAADLYIARRSTQASQATAKSALMAAARILGHDRLDQVDWAIGYQEAALIRAGVNRLEPGWAKVVWTAVRQVTVIARSLRLIDAETASDILDIDAPRGSGDRRGRTPSDDEIAVIVKLVAQDLTPRGRRDAAVVALLAGAGIRRAEASALDRDDVDLVQGLVTVRSGKGRRFRTIPMPQWAIALLTDWLLISTSPGPMLRQLDRWQNVGCRISGHAIGGVADRLCDGAQLERCGCHGLRRYAITDVLRHSDVGIARVFACHADCSTTIRSYDSRDLKDLELVVRQRTLST